MRGYAMCVTVSLTMISCDGETGDLQVSPADVLQQDTRAALADTIPGLATDVGISPLIDAASEVHDVNAHTDGGGGMDASESTDSDSDELGTDSALLDTLSPDISTDDSGPVTAPSWHGEVKSMLTPYCNLCHGVSVLGEGFMVDEQQLTQDAEHALCAGDTVAACIVTLVRDGVMPEKSSFETPCTPGGGVIGCPTAEEIGLLEAWAAGGYRLN